VVNASAYTEENRNVELRNSMEGEFGGTVTTTTVTTTVTTTTNLGTEETWLRDPDGILHGKIRGTDVRVYHGRDYIRRIGALKGQTLSTIDPLAKSQSYYVLEATGRSGDTTRLVSALVRENEPFSSFVFFQNRHPLGVSGAPRGLIHANDRIQFYFPDGNYVDSVSAVNGFEYKAGATTGNTNVANGNPEATQINLDAVNFDELKTKATFVGTAGLDAQIRMYSDGRVRVRQYTPARYEDVTYSYNYTAVAGYTTQTVQQTQQVQVGTVQETRQRQVISGYTTENYTVDVPVYETQTVTRTRQDPVYTTQQVEQTRQVPVYEMRPATCTRWVQVFVPYNTDAGSGTAVGGSGGVPGEYQWVQESYSCQQNTLVGYTTETYMTSQTVQTGTTTVTWQEQVQVQVGTTQEQRTRQVPVYVTENYTVDVPVYESQQVDVQQTVPVYEQRTYSWTQRELRPPVMVSETYLTLGDAANTIFIDGRITSLRGDLLGRLTVVGNEKVRITDRIRYVDAQGDTAMLNGGDYTKPYVRNEKYEGKSVLGVIARSDVLLTSDMPTQAEINATLLSATGRVGIDGFQIDANGEPVKNWRYGLSSAEIDRENAYINSGYSKSTFKYESLRRMGGIISNDRILETYVLPGSGGTSYVDAGFKRGSMRFDFNLLFNPPPNFVEVPRPVQISIAPVYFVRGMDE
jgi:glutathione peroxidase-family protein